jgi:hypothetical protein
MSEDKSKASFYTKDVPHAASGEELAKLTPSEARLFALRMATDPPRTAAECGRMVGLSLSHIDKQWKSIRSKLGRDPLIAWKQTGHLSAGGVEQFERLRMVPTDTLIKLAEMRAEALLRAITPEKLEKATVKDLTSGYRELINSRQLLKGEPTQILQVNQRENLKRLFPVVLKQLRRKGVDVDGFAPEAAARFLPKAAAESVVELEPESEPAT